MFLYSGVQIGPGVEQNRLAGFLDHSRQVVAMFLEPFHSDTKPSRGLGWKTDYVVNGATFWESAFHLFHI